MQASPAVIVLLGPPGSGKSTIGARLAELGFRWTDRERDLVERWGSREAFLSSKTEALPALHEGLRAAIGPGRPPLVIESTGISEREFIDDIQRLFPAFLVRLDVARETAALRVRSREPGRHLNTVPARDDAVWRAFEELVKPRPVDLVIDTGAVDPAAAARAIAAALARFE
jgi:hypothetical protein